MKLIASKLGQIIIFQLQWWLCVLSARIDSLHYVYVVALVIAGTLFCLQCQSLQKILLLLVLVLIGVVNDALLIYADVFIFSNCSDCVFIPCWLMTLWFCFFVWFLNANWLNQRYLFFGMFAMLGAPLSYYAGSKLGALTFGQSVLQVLLLIAADWFLLSLIFVRLNKRIV